MRAGMLYSALALGGLVVSSATAQADWMDPTAMITDAGGWIPGGVAAPGDVRVPLNADGDRRVRLVSLAEADLALFPQNMPNGLRAILDAEPIVQPLPGLGQAGKPVSPESLLPDLASPVEAMTISRNAAPLVGVPWDAPALPR